jgi:hypothetical protein
MNTRKLTFLTALAGTLALAEFGSAVIIGLGKDPWGSSFAVLFGGFFLLATWLLRSGRVGAGAIIAGILCLLPERRRPGRAGRADRGRRLAGGQVPPPGCGRSGAARELILSPGRARDAP